MKKVLSIIAMATLAVLFCGCNKENAPATGSKSVTISVSMPDDEITTKTALDGTSLVWKETDKIYLSGPDNAQTWQVGINAFIQPSTISIDGKIAKFTVFYNSFWQDEKWVVGYYGRRITSNVYQDGGWKSLFVGDGSRLSYIAYTNPCVQEYYNGNGPNGDYLAMANPNPVECKEETMKFQFQNLMSIIKIPVSSRSTRTLSSIKVVCKGDPLSGSFYCWKYTVGGFQPERCWFFDAVDGNDNSYEPIAEDFSQGTFGNWVKLVNINKTLTNTTQDFYLVVFPGNSGTLNFTLTDGRGNEKIVTWNNPINLESGKIYNFPSIVWE